MIRVFRGIEPQVAPDAFIEDSAVVIGDVHIGSLSSVWFNAVVRGDVNYVRIGERTNIQDSCVVHVTKDKWPTFLGSGTTIGHRAVLHGCRVGDNCLIGMGAIVLDGAEIGDNCMVAAGALVPPGMKVPAGSLVMGVPAKLSRDLTDEDIQGITAQGEEYLELVRQYKENP
ncbi:MAG: gamma carbonic anhydrase family protein [bacterium]